MIHAAFLMAATTAGATAAPPRPPDATYSYALQAGGLTLGTSTVVIDGSTHGTIVVKESASMLVPAAYSATTTARYDAATLHEIDYHGDFTLPNGTQRTDATVKPNAVTEVVSGQPGAIDIPTNPSAPLQLIGDNLVGSGVMLPAILHATGAKSFTLAALTTGSAVVCKVVSDPLPARPATVPGTDVELALEVAGIRFISWYDPATYVVHDITIPSQQAEIRLTATAAR